MTVIRENLPPGEGRSFFEIGCYPGRFLVMFKERLGHEVNGIDFADKVQLLSKELSQLGKNIAVLKGDFFEHITDKKYDVVASFGFVEHFEDSRGVIERHIALLKPEGYLIIGLPNLNNPIHRIINRRIIRYHNRNIMDCEVINRYFNNAGLTVLYSDFIVNYPSTSSIETDSKRRLLSLLKRRYVSVVLKADNLSRRIRGNRISRYITKFLLPGYILCIGKKES
jgi:2-polyprenyl-3-methyl-5-hydroxy-6-metoxy-1,4-benzoquinol methylase